MYRPTVPSALRRDDPALEQERAERGKWLEEERRLNAFESIGVSAAAASELTTREPEHWERQIDRMEVDTAFVLAREEA